ncbi:Uncharacterised protein [Vibrio cholerae]|nr:Uncharacterised protein [Vibrio cholerae]CSC44916.1 Uncharacterised protein [Vibrio cholerae]
MREFLVSAFGVGQMNELKQLQDSLFRLILADITVATNSFSNLNANTHIGIE